MDDPRWLIARAQADGPTVTPEWGPRFAQPIAGVAFKPLRPVITGFGHLTEMLRGEWLGDNLRVDQIFTSTLRPGAISAWHAHAVTTDRLFVASGVAKVVLYDSREASPTYGAINEYRLGEVSPALLIVPPKVWHGVQALGIDVTVVINAVDQAYDYEAPDHWRVPVDAVPYSF